MVQFVAELRLPPKPTTTPTPYVHTTATPRRKPPLNMNKDLNEVVRAKGTHFNSNTLKENEISNGIISSSNSGNSNSNSGRSSSSASGSNVYSSNRESSTNGVGVGVSGPNNINAANGLINGAEGKLQLKKCFKCREYKLNKSSVYYIYIYIRLYIISQKEYSTIPFRSP